MKYHYNAHSSPPQIIMLRQMNPAQTLAFYATKPEYNVIHA
jgi:hypothetical protein